MNEPSTTEYPSRSEFFLTGPKGKRDITAFYVEHIQDYTGFFTIDETPYFIKAGILNRLNLEPLRADRKTVDWRQGKFIHLLHGAVTFSSTAEPYAVF